VLPDDPPLTESLLFFCDLPCSLLPEPLLFAVVLFLNQTRKLLLDLLLLDAPCEDDIRAPEEREEVFFLDLPLGFEGIEIPFLLSCAMKPLAAQDAKHATKYPATLCVRTSL
jgi:hypothetical protein